jgi:phage terminase small subunit
MQQYVIEKTHAELLNLACQDRDDIVSMRATIKREGETVTGSTGQIAAHPLIAAVGAAEKRVAAFLKQFDEPKREKPGRPPRLGF